MNKIFALDLGTTKFCLGMYRQDRNLNPQIDLSTIDARGMYRGMLENFQEVSDGVKLLVEEAERKFKSDIRQVTIGIAGSHIKSHRVSVDMPIKGPISSSDLEVLKNIAKNQTKSSDREVLSILPIRFAIDERSNIDNPLYQTGRRLNGEYFVVDSDRFYLRDLIGAINQAGLEVSSFYPESYASSSVTVSQQMKDQGVAICDIGGGTTDGIVFKSGKPFACFTLNIGGLLMTRDISIALKTSLHEAEQLKTFFGLNPQKTNEHQFITSSDGKTRAINGETVQRILGHRVIEWTDHIGSHLLPYKGCLGTGIKLTGGGSMLENLSDVLAYRFKINVEPIHPKLDSGIKDDGSFAAKYATVLGLLHLEIQSKISPDMRPKLFNKIPFLQTFAQWVREFS